MARLSATLAWCLFAGAAAATTLPLPAPGNDLVGEISTVRVLEGETLIDIARKHGLGYQEIVATNPELDPWLPPVGAEVVLPKRFILPSAPREGIIINLAEMRLYYYPPASDGEGVVMTFPIGIGREGWSTPLGITRVVDKVEDPAWTVPASVRAEYAAAGTPLPAVIAPGPDNPLGRHAMRLGWTSYLIHGTNKPFGVGMRVSHGCIRMYPEDIEALFNHVPINTSVWIIDQPYKLGREDGQLFMEAHAATAEADRPPADNFSVIISAIEAVTPKDELVQIRRATSGIAGRELGIPEPIGRFQPSIRSVVNEGWMVQLGAFSDKRNASRLAGKLEAIEAPVTVQARINDGYCHVLVGPYDDEVAAMEALEAFRESTGYSGEVLPANRHGMLSDCLI